MPLSHIDGWRLRVIRIPLEFRAPPMPKFARSSAILRARVLRRIRISRHLAAKEAIGGSWGAAAGQAELGARCRGRNCKNRHNCCCINGLVRVKFLLNTENCTNLSQVVPSARHEGTEGQERDVSLSRVSLSGLSGSGVVQPRKCSRGEGMWRFSGQKDHFEKWFKMVQNGSRAPKVLQVDPHLFQT